MAEPARENLTQLLNAASGGDVQAAAEILPVVYDELRKLARSHMGKERASHTLQPTALVHEAYLRLVGDANLKWDGRGHFFAAAARAMRRILVDRARHRARLKRGGDRRRVDLTEDALALEPEATDVLALDEALVRLEAYDKRKADVVMLRFFAGLGIEDTAAGLNVSSATVRNDWTFAKAWLLRELNRAPA
jgi:RNA polymerase sigma factor (TIGR02999 family)